MATEDEGKQPEEGQEGSEGAQDAGANEEPKDEGKQPEGSTEDVKDKHGQPGVNRDKYKRDVEERDKRIAELEAELAEAAETKEGREKLEKSIADLKAEMADKDTSHALEIAGCVDVKAAKARLDDFDGDVAKLKAECPYLFEEKRKPGTTELPPAGAAKGPAKTIREALRG